MEKSKIEWASTVKADGSVVPGNTFNPWLGCTKVSPGCLNCYAENLMDTRYGRVKWGAGQPRSLTSDDYWKQPGRWNSRARESGVRTKVFCASLSDWLDNEVPAEWLARLLAWLVLTPHLDWLLLTKRPQNWQSRLEAVAALEGTPFKSSAAYAKLWLSGYQSHNVWVGVTAENQAMADERVPLLLSIPAKVRFLSCEPLLGNIDLTDIVSGNAANVGGESHLNSLSLEEYEPEDDEEFGGALINWVIVGGESGGGARPCSLEWIRSIVHQCQQAAVPAFVKQLGADPFVQLLPGLGGGIPWVKSSGKGGNIEDFPSDLRIREFPDARH